MTKEELIKQIQENVPDKAEIVIFDHRKNLEHDDGDGSGAGIYKDFSVVHFKGKQIKKGSTPFSALLFNNEDYQQ